MKDRNNRQIVLIDSMHKWYDIYMYGDEMYIYNYYEARAVDDSVFEYNLNALSKYQVKLALMLYILRNPKVHTVEVIKYGDPYAKLYEMAFDFDALREETDQMENPLAFEEES